MSCAMTEPPSKRRSLGPSFALPSSDIGNNPWLLLWKESYRIQPIVETPRLSPTATFSGETKFPFELIWNTPDSRTIPENLKLIEQALGVTVKELAHILRVSRPMIYHWRDGAMEPSPKNRARIEAIARIAIDWNDLEQKPIGQRLHFDQVEGNTLMSLLYSDALDVPAIRAVMGRLVSIQKASDVEVATRKALLHSIVEGESSEERMDIIRERQSAGKPSYIGDACHSGKLFEIQPDGTRRPGRIVDRKFVPEPDGKE